MTDKRIDALFANRAVPPDHPLAKRRAFEAKLNTLIEVCCSTPNHVSRIADLRNEAIAAYDAAGREGQPVSSIDYWQNRGHHVCPECNGTRVRSYRQADHLGGQYVDVPCECAHPAPKADAAAVPAVVRTAPKRIWLQISDDQDHAAEPFPYGSEITWCEDSVVDVEVEYVRADLAASPAFPEKR